MGGIKDSENIEELRRRLYERGNPVPKRQNHQLNDTKTEVPTSWPTTKQSSDNTRHKSAARIEAEQAAAETTPASSSSSVKRPAAVTKQVPSGTNTPPRPMGTTKRKQYRKKIILLGLAFFVGALLVSSFLMLFGNNTISGENISVSVEGPFTVGGGEVMPVQVAVTNDNVVPIQSAILIVEYHPGTVSAGDENRQLFNERLPLDTIASGETVNVPLRAVVFGEENEEQIIDVSIEYRVEGSNARFVKEADPLRYKISSSPVSITTEALQQISSGQSTDVAITIDSNAPTTLSDVLVRAEYPIGFDFESAEPRPYSGENVWLIEDLEPEGSATIVVSGVVIGNETDEYAMNFTVGVPDDRDRDQMAAVFGAAQTEFVIEQPFLNVALSMGNVVNDTKVVDPGQPVNASVEITNTLKDTIYDIEVDVVLGGNAIADLEVGPPNGFYDSARDTIVWDVSNSPELSELQPGDSTRIAFVVTPDTAVDQTPEVTMDVDVRARRVRESQVAETLMGTAAGAVRVVSMPEIQSTVTHGSGQFSDSGPIPPQAEEQTTYTITMMVENGSNDVSESEVTAVLPTYVSWLDQTTGDGLVSYNSTSRSITWALGNMDANDTAYVSFQVGVTPSRTQVGQTPVILNEQSFRATDDFTGTTVRDDYPARTTEMSLEAGFEEQNGRVVE